MKGYEGINRVRRELGGDRKAIRKMYITCTANISTMN